MAGKGALPLVLMAGAAAVVLGGKKKKRKKRPPTPTPDVEGKIDWKPPRLEHSEEGGEKLIFDEECAAFADKLNYDKHNAYITGMFHSQTQAGNTNARDIVMAMLEDQAGQCPWGDPAEYTELMLDISNQLLAAVQKYAADAKIPLT